MLILCSIALLSLGIDLESSSMLLHCLVFSIFERIVLSAFSDRRLRGLVCAEGLKLGLVDQVHAAANVCRQLLYN